MVETLPSSSSAVRRRLDDALSGFFDAQRASLPAEAQPLLDELEAVVDAGGKRLRPIFCVWGHLAAGGTEDTRILRASASLELLHTFALIHDDVMDGSPVRRGRPASHRLLAELARALPHRGDADRFGTSAAILAGDLALVMADLLLSTSGFGSDVLARATARFDDMRVRAIAGQYLDLLSAHRGEADESTTRRIGTLKSAGYTVADPLVIGALLGDASPRVLEILEGYGRPLGEAFQIRDDVLGVFGDPARTGKDRDGDLREGKQTMLIAKARGLAESDDRAFLDDHLGDAALTADDADGIRRIIRETGALEETLELIASLASEAKGALDPTVVSRSVTEALEDLADEIATRED